jgi:hypothetical protein
VSDYLNQAELKVIAKVKQRGALIQWLRDSKINFGYTGGGEKKGDVWTNKESMNNGLSLNKTENPEGNFGT